MPATASGGKAHSYGATAGTSSVATTLSAHASANTKGTAVQLTAATSFDAHWMLVTFTGLSANASFLVDVMVGAATEQVVLPDLFVVGRGATGSGGAFLFPLFVPKGARLTARCQSSSGGATMMIALTLFAAGPLQPGFPPPPGQVSGYGATASSTGTNVDPGGSANTDSAWTQLTAATDRDHHWLVLAIQCSDTALTGATSWRVSLGIGAATEEVLVGDLHFSADATSDLPYNPVLCLPVFVPKGSRLTAKARSSSTTDGDRDVWLRVYGAG